VKEQDFLKIIKKQTNSIYIGDDCAFLEDFGIVVSQDNFVENIHFKRAWATPFQIGYKATAVNISDILASGAKPYGISIGLSLPNVDTSFIEDFYRGVEVASYGAKIIGGDITGADKIFVSITAIGETKNRKISSRSNAKPGYAVITSGKHGDSSLGLKELQNGGNNKDLILAHLEPKLDQNFSEEIATQIKEDYAMMDSSDGLADALFQIAKASNVKIKTHNIPGMFGGEDYKLVAAVPKYFLKNLTKYYLLGDVVEYDGEFLNIDGKGYSFYDELGTYNHFE